MASREVIILNNYWFKVEFQCTTLMEEDASQRIQLRQLCAVKELTGVQEPLSTWDPSSVEARTHVETKCAFIYLHYSALVFHVAA